MTRTPRTCLMDGCTEPARSTRSLYCVAHRIPHERNMEKVRNKREQLGLRRSGPGNPGTAIHLLLGPMYERYMRYLDRQEHLTRTRHVDGWLWPAGMSGEQAAELNHDRD